MDKNLEPTFTDQIQQAMALAFEAHAGEWRDVGSDGVRLPYISHVFDIMRLASRVGFDASDIDLYRAIILHDTVESGFDIARIEAVSAELADHVRDLTFLPSSSDPAAKAQEKAEYIRSFKAKPIVVVVAKVLDRLCNVRDFINDQPDYALEYLKKARPLFDTFEYRKPAFVDRWGQECWRRLMVQYKAIQADAKAAGEMP